MGTNTLTATGDFQNALLTYFVANASDSLKQRVAAGNKTISGAEQYITDEAKKRRTNGANCVAIADAEVYGMLMHYFEEDALNCETPTPTAAPKPAKTAKPAKKKPATPSEVLIAAPANPAPLSSLLDGTKMSKEWIESMSPKYTRDRNGKVSYVRQALLF